MATVGSWIKAARLRTLPLAVSGILMGAAIAHFEGEFNLKVTILAVITALFIQIFSNFANDYGDSQKGTDNQHRVGPKRTVQGGEITPAQMKSGMVFMTGLSLTTGIWLVSEGTRGLDRTSFFVFVGLGIIALIAAYRYTAGGNPYGYAGLGDLAVFLFFGLLPVAGTFFLNTHQLNPEIFLPAITIGLFSTGVLNLNNMRDIENDRNSGKKTMVVRMGSKNSRYYHTGIILFGWIAAMLYSALTFQSVYQLLFLLTLPLFIKDLVQIRQIQEPRLLDPFLKKLSVSTLLFTLLFGIGVILANV